MPKVLLLDDDAQFRRLAAPALAARGFEVLEAPKGRVADRIIAESRPDIVVVDGLLPDTSGIEWIERLRRNDDDLPVVFLSAFFRDIATFKRLTQELGVLRVEHKPIAPEAFAAELAELVGVATPASIPPKPPPPGPSGTEDKPVDEDVYFVPMSVEVDLDEAYDTEPPKDFAELHAHYVANLPQTLDSLLGAVVESRRATGERRLLEAARLEAHQVAGTAGSFGFERIGAAASRIEYILVEALAGRPADWSVVDGALAILSGQGDVAQVSPAAPRLMAPVELDDERCTLLPRILVVDDDPALVEYLESALVSGVHVVLGASDVASAVRLAVDEEPAVALVGTPFGHPDRTAELMASLRERAPGLPIGIVSIEGDTEARRHAASLGADVFLSHPIDDDSLLGAVERLEAKNSPRPPRVAIQRELAGALGAALDATAVDPCIVSTLDALLGAARPDAIVLAADDDTLERCRILRASPAGQDAAIIFVGDVISPHDALLAGADSIVASDEEDAAALIASRAERVRCARRFAGIDPLTQLPTRRVLAASLRAALSSAHRRGRSYTLVALRLQGLEVLHREHGPGAAERALLGLGRLLRSRFRLGDLRGRFTDDTFVLGFAGVDAETMAPVVRRMQQELAALAFAAPSGERFRVSSSAGLAGFPEAGDDLRALLRTAERRAILAGDGGIALREL